LRVKDENIQETTFQTCFRHYEFIVVPFGLTNDPDVFMSLMNGMFRKYLNKFIHVFLDDILIHTKSTLDEHLNLVLECLRENNIYVERYKCSLFQLEIHCSTRIISPDGIVLDTTMMLIGSSLDGWEE